MTLLTLVTGGHAAARERAIAAAIGAAGAALDATAKAKFQPPIIVILEGLASGSAVFDALTASNILQLHRIAPGCMCCIGNLTLRVTLNRILRHPPQHLFISLATDTHLPQLRSFLTSAPYDALLNLTDDLVASAHDN